MQKERGRAVYNPPSRVHVGSKGRSISTSVFSQALPRWAVCESGQPATPSTESRQEGHLPGCCLPVSGCRGCSLAHSVQTVRFTYRQAYAYIYILFIFFPCMNVFTVKVWQCCDNLTLYIHVCSTAASLARTSRSGFKFKILKLKI